MRSTSKKVKLSVVSPSGQVKTKQFSLSQIRLACIELDKAKARQEGKLLIMMFNPSIQSISKFADLTHHSHQLLADAHLETGVGDPDSDFDFQPNPASQHAPWDEDIDPNGEEEVADESVDKRTKEIIYQFVKIFISLLLSILTEFLPE